MAARFQTRLVGSYRTKLNGQFALLCWSFEGQSSLQNTQVVCAVGEVGISRLPSSLSVKNAICAMSLTRDLCLVCVLSKKALAMKKPLVSRSILAVLIRWRKLQSY